MSTVKIVPCEDCGKEIQRKANKHRAQLCLECGVKRNIARTQQMRAREGPYYERWLASGGATGLPKQHSGGKK